MIKFEVTINDNTIEREMKRVSHKEVAADFFKHSVDWLSIKGAKVTAKIVEKKRKLKKK